MPVSRDDFKTAVKRQLATRAGHRCSNPKCRAATEGPGTDKGGSASVGVASHITAAASGGPRYDPTLTAEQRASYDNGIWLCQTCSRKIDHDVETYTTEVLRAWKESAEQEARSSLGVPGYGTRPAVEEVITTVEWREVPPYGFAFEDGEIPASFSGAKAADRPGGWAQIWVDKIPVRLIIENCSKENELAILDIEVEREGLNLRPQSAIYSIPQGARRALELAFDLNAPRVRPQQVEMDDFSGASPKLLCSDYFGHGNYIVVEPGGVEVLLLTFLAFHGAYAVRPFVSMRIAGTYEKRELLPPLESMRVVSHDLIPNAGKVMSVHRRMQIVDTGKDYDCAYEYRGLVL